MTRIRRGRTEPQVEHIPRPPFPHELVALMFFLYVAATLALLITGGIYLRRRLLAALRALGVGERRIRIAHLAIRWFLYGFPAILIASVLTSLLLGFESAPRFDGLVGTWLLAFPFFWALLILLQSLPWLLAIDGAYLLLRRRRAAIASRVRTIGVVAAVGVFAVYTPARVLLERDALRVREHRLGETSAATRPFRIAFVADTQQDLHADADRVKEVYRIVSEKRPDLVLSGGDWINMGPDYIEEAAATATELESRLGTFSVRGDHEHFAYFDRERSVTEVESALKRHGVAMLSDELRWFEHGGKRIAVLFINHNYIHRTEEQTIDRLLDEASGADYTIAIVHQLDERLTHLLEDCVDLILAAHTHGGQINPVLGAVHVAPARLETPYVDGRYQHGETTIIVTAGIGYSLVPFRYAAPASVEIIELALGDS